MINSMNADEIDWRRGKCGYTNATDDFIKASFTVIDAVTGDYTVKIMEYLLVIKGMKGTFRSIIN